MISSTVSIRPAFPAGEGAPALSAENRAYLTALARETWESLASMVHPATGLPYDSSDFQKKNTSVSNIGLYAASLVAACELGIIPRAQAVERARRLLDGLEKFKSWRGFCQSWNNVETFAPGAEDTWISVLDSGNLAGGLLALKHAFPEVRSRAGRYVDAMDWSAFYDPATHALFGGYNMATSSLNKDWKLTFLGSDARLAGILAIGAGKIDPAYWGTLSRETEVRYGQSYLAPGWQGGGLFMQYISGLFIDDRGTPMGLSAARFAYAQRIHATLIGSAVWGWSASDSPADGYLGWQKIKDNVVTPHASALPLAYFPEACVANLRRLEALGLRPTTVYQGQERSFGFRDAIDLETKRVTRTYLTLDQSMLFLSVADALKPGVVTAAIAKDPAVRKARRLIVDYQNVDLDAFWKEVRSLRLDAPQVSVRALSTPDHYLPGKPFRVPVRCVHDHGAGGNYLLRWRVITDRSDDNAAQGEQPVVLPAKGGIPSVSLTLGAGVYLLQAALWDAAGKIVSEDALPFRVCAEEAPERRVPVPVLAALPWEGAGSGWVTKPFELSRWASNGDKDATARIKAGKDGGDEVLKLDYALNNGGWMEMFRANPGDFTGLKLLSWRLRYSGRPAKLELKLEDADGSVFGCTTDLTAGDGWRTTRIDAERLQHLWGGDARLDTRRIARMVLAVAGPHGTSGTLEIKSLEGRYTHVD